MSASSGGSTDFTPPYCLAGHAKYVRILDRYVIDPEIRKKSKPVLSGRPVWVKKPKNR
jgi:hypothetical protein